MPPFECDFLDLPARLAGEPALPVYLVVGEEPFLKDRAVRAILASLGFAPGAECSRESYDGEEDLASGLGAVISGLLTPSLFGGPRIAVVSRADTAADSFGDQIEGFVNDQDGGAHLVLDAVKVDRRKKTARVAKAFGGIVTCRKLYDQPPPWVSGNPWDNDVARWTRDEARSAGLVLSLMTAQHLIDRVGPGLRGLSEEIGKISIYKKAGPASPVEISPADIEAVVGDYNEYGMFKLTDAVSAGDLKAALKICSALFAQGLRKPGEDGSIHDESVIAVILTERLHAKVRELLKARNILEAGLGVNGLVEKLKKHPVFAKTLAKEAEAFGSPRLASMMRDLLDADLALKTGGGDPRTVVEILLLRLLGPR